MYLVIYPVDSFERHEFDHYDTSKPEEAKKVFYELYSALHNDDNFNFYNISTTSYSSKHNNLNDFTEAWNNEEMWDDGTWLIWLNLSEEDVVSVIDQYNDDVLNTVGDGTEYFILTPEIKLVEYPNDDTLLAYFCKVEAEGDIEDGEKLLMVKSSSNGYVINHEVYDSDKGELIGSFKTSEEQDGDKALKSFIEENYAKLKERYAF